MPTEAPTFNPKSLGKTPTKKSENPKAQATKQKQKPEQGSDGVLDRQLRQQAEVIVAAHQLLADLDRRSEDEDIAPSKLARSAAELLVLEPMTGEVQAKVALASKAELREAVENAKEVFQEARKAQAEAELDVDAVGGASGKLLIDHLRQQQARLDSLAEATSAARDNHERAKQQYQSLLNKAPKQLAEQVEAAITLAKRLQRNLAAIDVRITAKKDFLRRLENPRIESYPLNPYASSAPDDEQIKADKKERGNELRIGLQELEEEREALAEKTDAELDKVNAPLHRWALAGKLTVDMLLE